ncbi:transcription termination factor NusA, partial [Planctomycetota bacterium]
MLGADIIRIIDGIHREKKIDKEILFTDIEMALLSATRKKFGTTDDITIHINRETGDIEAYQGDNKIAPETFGRIAAQTAKQVMIQRIREAERKVIYEDYEGRVGELLNGTVQRFEGSSIVINLGNNSEGILPRREQVYDESYRPGDRIKAIIREVRKTGQKVRIILSRTSEDLVRRLFELEVPEISEHSIEIKVIVREPGFRTKIAVTSFDSKIDCVGACVGVRGTRIKNIVDELNGEKIDIVRWNDSIEVLIANSLRPAEIDSITLNYDDKKAEITVPRDQLSLAIGKRGQNVRLASKLAKWEIDIVSLEDDSAEREQEAKHTLSSLFGDEEDASPESKPVPVSAESLFQDSTEGDA